MDIFKSIGAWALFIVALPICAVIAAIGMGCAPRSVRNGWDDEANRISGLDDKEAQNGR